MNLIVDIGNTRIKIAVFDNRNQMIFYTPVTPENFIKTVQNLEQKYKLTHAGISQVGKKPKGFDEFIKTRKIFSVYINSNIHLPFQLNYQTPHSLGADRLALVAGAVSKQPEHNTLIIDAGTCVTYDFIDKDNIYHGGAISPGLQLRYQSLNNYTAKLPLLTPPENEILPVGNNTQNAIHSGVIFGLVHEIEGFIVKYNLKFKDLTVYLTGGDQKLLDRYIKNKIFVSSKFLLLEGINHLLNLNK